MTIKQYERKLAATQKVTSFMGGLAMHYSASDMTQLWRKLETLCIRYGIVFMGDMIDKDKSEVELALLREVRAS